MRVLITGITGMAGSHLAEYLLANHPDVAVYGTFRQVYDTGATHQEWGILIPLARPEDGVLEDRYFNYIQQARFNEFGRVDGVLVFAFEVTAEFGGVVQYLG